MDEYFNILLIVVVAAVSLIRFFMKRKELGESDSPGFPAGNPREESEAYEGYGRGYQEIPEPLRLPVPPVYETHPDSQEIIFPHTLSPAFRPLSDSFVDNREGNSLRKAQPPQMEQSISTRDDDMEVIDISNITDRFDLPAAVVYSEILRPKYQQDGLL